ncbi:MAG: para-aminobenzoate synthase, (PABA) [Thelocarpon impressellum]|nr:MAG: para-aminobenzoate synthase, (PABA) [Thelocarpon impressellum]
MGEDGGARVPARSAEPSRRYQILFVDSDDSFSNNIVALLETRLDDVAVTVVGNDIAPDIPAFLSDFDAVVVGPGPGDPTEPRDTGSIAELWKLSGAHQLPILGICLGFQSLACAFGASVGRLRRPTHGMPCEVLHDGSSIFRDVEEVHAIRYHSLHANIGHIIQANGCVKYPRQLWEPTPACPELRPLAWDLNDGDNGAVLMALRHVQLPFWGLQYHPESICTEEASVKVIENWWSDSKEWLSRSGRVSTTAAIRDGHNDATWRPRSNRRDFVGATHGQDSSTQGSRRIAPAAPKAPVSDVVATTTLLGLDVTAVQLCEALRLHGSEVIVLDTAAKQDGTGRFSVIGLVIPARTVKIRHDVASATVKTWIHLQPAREARVERLADYQGDLWHYLAEFLGTRRASCGAADSPFWGGIMGFVPYETGLASTGVSPPGSSGGEDNLSHPDAVFAFIERSIVIDHRDRRIYIQSLVPDDAQWMKSVRDVAGDLGSRRLTADCGTVGSIELERYLGAAQVQLPDERKYRKKIRRCKELIAAGESYELCLTASTTIKIPRSAGKDVAWALYKRLRRRNPAPFGAYVRLGPATILSSSPERFLSWDRKGTCQMRPIKGTVHKGPGVTTAIATQMLEQPKERAENLMIVDLIRHDLHGVVGAGQVYVRKLMSVESYKTVWQLVSVVEGQLPRPRVTGHQPRSGHENLHAPPQHDASGIDVLAACLPPGSMTGAPKKRSCELLRSLEEDKPRGIYSGVLGYMCVGGGGDFAVIIRTAYRWEESQATDDVDGSEGILDVWSIGAGGAITALSSEDDEWMEMRAKLQSTKAAFDADAATVDKLAGVGPKLQATGSLELPQGPLPDDVDVDSVWQYYLARRGFRAGGGSLDRGGFSSAAAGSRSWGELVERVNNAEAQETTGQPSDRRGRIRIERSFRAMVETIPTTQQDPSAQGSPADGSID